MRPSDYTSPKLPAKELKKWLDEGRPLTLLDTRNDYEVRLRTFENALPIGVSHFREFPEAVRKLPPELKQQPIVWFCTGGIRCEKAGPFMEQEGFQQIYQLEGGILKCFEECGGDHYTGDCFVFDQRVALSPRLEETATTQCHACQQSLTVEDQQSEHYVPGVSCSSCRKLPAEQPAVTLAEREALLAAACDPLPGSAPATVRTRPGGEELSLPRSRRPYLERHDVTPADRSHPVEQRLPGRRSRRGRCGRNRVSCAGAS